MLQSALYAAERMSHAIWVSHTINLVIIGESLRAIMVPLSSSLIILVDDVAYVWWYDNESVIQSQGINFVQDLPHFLVLLLCFERFTNKNWGVMPEFRLSSPTVGHCSLSLPSSLSRSAIDITIDHDDKIRDHFGIVGRATQMLPATSQSPDPREVGKNLGDVELVAKVYWPEASRVGEGEIIEMARQIASQNKDVHGHIPDLIRSHVFEEYSTVMIRSALGIITKGRRVLCVMVFRRLHPITDLIGERFWSAYWECFHCECISYALLLCANILWL
jgi:hypothetical protein